ncbi:MAG: 16S rRNA (guanine(966)-N(2))-methyltransferase RsmD [Acidobacteriota bacterium]
MRVIAGSLKGRRLKTPWWDGLRPTSDKLRETLFNILAPRLAGARVLDGYAGTGALGIEAFSRGAAWITFIEDDRRAQMLIAENLAHCGIENSYAIIRAKVARALDTLHNQPAFEPFEIVLFDPPYALHRGPRSGDDDLDAILTAAGRVLAPAGILVLERARRDPAPETAGRLRRTRTVVSGDSALWFYETPS